MRKIDKDTKGKRDKNYNDWARKRPAYLFLTILVVLAAAMGINACMTTTEWGVALIYLLSLSTISTALFFLLRLILRDISKIYPEKIIFCDRLNPMIRILYVNDATYTEEHRSEIREKIKSKKKIDLQKYKNKTHKNKNYAKRVNEAVPWLLDVTRFDDILFEFNCFYGFWRNLTGALLVDSLLVFVLVAVNKWLYALPFGNNLIWIGCALFLLTIFATLHAYKNGRIFAKRVYDVFMNLDDDNDNY